jgi:hypothetical protein
MFGINSAADEPTYKRESLQDTDNRPDFQRVSGERRTSGGVWISPTKQSLGQLQLSQAVYRNVTLVIL